jgi:hypothetical protein
VAQFYGAAYAPAAGPLRILAWALPLMLVWEVLRAAALALRREAAAGRVAVRALLLEALAGGDAGSRAGCHRRGRWRSWPCAWRASPAWHSCLRAASRRERRAFRSA